MALVQCTFYNNHSPEGSAISLRGSCYGPVRIENTIIAFNTGSEAIECDGGMDVAILSCCDIYGNTGGDWVGCLADQLGVNGNIQLDPLFCDAAAGDLRLRADSPCAPYSPQNPDCDRAGAWPVGCGGTATRETTWGALRALFR